MTAPSLMVGPVGRVLEHVKKARRSGSGWVGLCPAHDDKAASLSIAVGADGRVLLNCHAQCPTQAIVSAMGLTMSDLFPPKQPSAPAVTRTQRMVKSYDYRDADGNLLFQTCRMEPKTFRQRRPDGNGGWVYSLGDVVPVLYRLPEILDAVSDGKQVYIVEGEKDADALVGYGYNATTSPMGAGKWREAYSEFLKGANVVILPDNDDVGRAHAEQVAASLHSRGCIVRVVPLPGLPPKGDVSDWLADQSNDLDMLNEITANAPRWSPDGLEAKHRTRWRLDELWENNSIMRPPPPIVPRIAWSGRSTLLVAREKAGKSTFTGYMAAAVSRGTTFLGDPCEHGSVVIVGLEEFVGDTARRLRHFNADATRIEIVVGFVGDTRERPNELMDHVEAVDPLLVIVDSLSAYSMGLADDDNSATQMTRVMQPLSDMAHKRGVALVIVHHATKLGDGKARGSTAITAGVDVVCEFWAPDEDAEPTLRRMRSKGRVPLVPQYDFRFDGDTYRLDTADAPLDQRIVEFIRHHPGTSIRNLRDMVKGKFDDISSVTSKLIASGMILNDGDGRASRLYIRESGHRAGTGVEPQGNRSGLAPYSPEGAKGQNQTPGFTS